MVRGLNRYANNLKNISFVEPTARKQFLPGRLLFGPLGFRLGQTISATPRRDLKHTWTGDEKQINSSLNRLEQLERL